MCSYVFLIDLICMLSTNLKVLSGANERYGAFFLPLFHCKLPSFRLQSLLRDTTRGLWGCTASHLQQLGPINCIQSGSGYPSFCHTVISPHDHSQKITVISSHLNHNKVGLTVSLCRRRTSSRPKS